MERQGGEQQPVQAHEIGRRRYLVADVDPIDEYGVHGIATGAALWLVAFVLLVPFYERLQADDRIWWLWTCLAGFGLGMFGWDWCRRRRRRIRDDALAASLAEPQN